MLHAFALAFRQLGQPALLRVFAKSLAITLLVFGAIGVGLYFGIAALVTQLFGPQPSGFAALLAAVTGLALFWLAFRGVAIAVVGLFGDEVVAAVEARSYPAALARARPIPVARAAMMGARSVARLIGYNLLASPLYGAAAFTAVGLPVAFFVVNGWLLGRDLGDMVAARHLDPSQLRDWRAQTRGQRFLAGLAASGLFVVPGLNLVAPIVGAAAMTHLFHRAHLSQQGRHA